VQPAARRSHQTAQLVTLAGAIGACGALAVRARRGTVSAGEERAFRLVNGLPRSLFAPLWIVMQAGSLGAVGVAALVARTRSRPTAVGVGVAGASVWGGAKLLKRLVRRGRPAEHLVGVTIRGTNSSGLGFPSGHAAVAVTLAAVGSRLLPAAGRRMAWSSAVAVGAARQYVGAHLPLDVVGGTALGLAAGNLANLVIDLSNGRSVPSDPLASPARLWKAARGRRQWP
jgi:glycosyltransferase 2 family protein